MKKKILVVGSVCCWLLLACLCGACSEEAVYQPEDVSAGDGTPELAISMAGDFNLQTRSQLVSSEPMHHVEHLYAYLFAIPQGVGATVDDAVCVYEEKLPWTPSQESVSMFRCKLDKAAKEKMEAAGTTEFLWMVLGVDNHPDTYTFPVAPAAGQPAPADPHLGMEQKTLKQVKIACASTATEADVRRMNFTELFAGYARVSASESLIHVHLKRRVAGVLCYLQDIPAKVDDYHIIGAQLLCVGGVNTEASLTPAFEQQNPSVFKPLTKNSLRTQSTLLAEINLKELGAEAKGDLLYIPPMDEPGLVTLPNTLLMGAYMLPVEAAKTHFAIALVGETRNADGVVTGDPHVFTATETQGYFQVKNKAGEVAYAVWPDYIYNIGVKPWANSTDYDDPLSLKGKPIVVIPQPWHEKEVNVEFPNTQMGMLIETGKTADFRYNCMKLTDVITIKASEDMKEKTWTLTSPESWVKFYDPKNKVYVETLKGKGEAEVQMRLDEYVNDTSRFVQSPAQDYRHLDIMLQVDGTPMRMSAPIRQWNALIVQTWNEKHKESWNIAFARLDNGTQFNSDGTLNEDSLKLYPWGYVNWHTTSIFDSGLSSNTGDRGDENYRSMKLEASQTISDKKKEEWKKCVVNVASVGPEDSLWYVPARIEMHALMYAWRDESTAFLNQADTVKWWTCTTVGDDDYLTYVSRTLVADDPEWWKNKDKEIRWDRRNRYRVRLARQIPKKNRNPQ